jgi:hypothetical protein
VRIFKTKGFARFARRQSISEAALSEAVLRAERGSIDADLGSGVIKQRVPRPEQGRSGGFRVLILYRAGERAVFVHGFAKSDQDNIGDDDLERLRALAGEFLGYDTKQVGMLVDAGAWVKVHCDG